MAGGSIPVVEVKPLQTGTEEYEKNRLAILEELAAKIPKEYHLPKDIIDKPPLNVTDIPRTCGILSKEELYITEDYDATALAEAIANRKLTAVEVATAFCKRAAIAHQLSRCLTDFFMEEALERAEFLDYYLQRQGETVGPLHGVPLSIKEHVSVKGHYASWGYIGTRTFSEADCQMVRILRAAGAVFYVKTNQPQAIMHLECCGFHGRALNPNNIHLSPGGSSGGEAALIALRGSVLGIGTDIGGSIRGPAGFCGIYGYKPTAYTLPAKDLVPGGFPAELNVLVSVGPMSTSLRDCDLFARVNKDAKPHLEDPRCVPFPWTGLSTKVETPLKIGIMKHDGNIIPQPPVLKALEWAERQLAPAKDIALKSYMPYEAATAMAHIRKAYWPDSGLNHKKIAADGGELLHPLTKWIIKDAEDDTERTGTEVNEMRWTRDNFRSEFALDWNKQDLDYVLCPVFVGPACAHDTAFYCELSVSAFDCSQSANSTRGLHRSVELCRLSRRCLSNSSRCTEGERTVSVGVQQASQQG